MFLGINELVVILLSYNVHKKKKSEVHIIRMEVQSCILYVCRVSALTPLVITITKRTN